MSIIHMAAGVTGLICLSLACAYALLTVVALICRKLERPHEPQPAGPPVTVLKPLCGAEPDLYANLRSFCIQDYAHFQIVFGVRDSADPALQVAERLAAEFPHLAIDIVVNAQQHGANRKVSNLINMLEVARHEVLVIADSDALVGPDYLATVTAPLQDESTGLVTCLYHSVPAGTGWSQLGAMYVNEWYMPSVLLGRLLGNREFASGQTLCLRRQMLTGNDGLRSIAHHLADDYQLGALVRQRGQQIVLSSYVTTPPPSRTRRSASMKARAVSGSKSAPHCWQRQSPAQRPCRPSTCGASPSRTFPRSRRQGLLWPAGDPLHVQGPPGRPQDRRLAAGAGVRDPRGGRCRENLDRHAGRIVCRRPPARHLPDGR